MSRCALTSPQMDKLFSTVGFPVYVACDLAWWPDFTTMAADKPLWKLVCRAQREIAALPEHGWRGRLMVIAMGPRVTRAIHTSAEKGYRPLDYQAFNRFHHGGKVRDQDIDSLRECLESGRR
ncbi:hypothetical protein [Nocardia sp. NBC_01377]|uniref:hypothetical protein n=1 Tax=Nocardia sp. NBC_01377 TaxID=2903595 RepID=UPI0038709C5F